MMDLTENFLKLLQIAVIVVGVLALYFTYIGYNVKVEARTGERSAVVLGNFLLSSNCLTYGDTTSLFSEDKINNMMVDSSCIKNSYPYGSVNINIIKSTKKWTFNLGTANVGGEAEFDVAVKMSSGEVNLAQMVVDV